MKNNIFPLHAPFRWKIVTVRYLVDGNTRTLLPLETNPAFIPTQTLHSINSEMLVAC